MVCLCDLKVAYFTTFILNWVQQQQKTAENNSENTHLCKQIINQHKRINNEAKANHNGQKGKKKQNKTFKKIEERKNKTKTKNKIHLPVQLAAFSNVLYFPATQSEKRKNITKKTLR